MSGQRIYRFTRCLCAAVLAISIIASSTGCALPGTRTGGGAAYGPPAGGTMS